MSLLDDVSIVVTPNGYKAGELYAVKPTYAEGTDKVNDGNFPLPNVNWTVPAGWAIADNEATCSSGNGSLTQDVSAEIGKQYKVTFDISTFTSGTLHTDLGGASSQTTTTTGSKTFYFTATSTGLLRFYGGSFLGSIGNVIVKELTSADMDVTRATAATRVDENGLVNYAEIIGGEEDIDGNFPLPNTSWTLSGFTIADNKLHCVSDGTYNNAIQSNVFVIGRTYKITFDITGWTLGDIRVRPSGQSPFQLANANGSYTFYYTATNHQIAIERNTPCNMYLENLVVKEVTRDNVPRIDYTGGGCPHILAEPQRTNSILQSNQFDTTWLQSGTLTSGQDGVGGSTDAWKFENPITTSGLHQPNTISGVQTMSAYFKKNSNYGVRFYAFGSLNSSAWFDLNNGVVVGSGTNSTPKVESAGADWFRCSMTFDSTNTDCYFYVTNNAQVQAVGNITLQYAQVEVGSYATSYIPTSGSTVTRNQDIFTRDGIGSLINSTEGVLFVEMAALSDDLTYRILSLSDGTDEERIYIQYTNVSNTIAVVVKEGGSTQANMSYVLSDETAFSKIAIKWKVNDFALWIDGFERATDTLGDAPTGLNRLAFDNGNSVTEGNKFFGKVKQLQVYTTALGGSPYNATLSDARLAALTS